MDSEKKAPATEAKELGHQLTAHGDVVVVQRAGNDADRSDMYRMGKVQQMQVSSFET